jgi:hypothetical protein
MVWNLVIDRDSRMHAVDGHGCGACIRQRSGDVVARGLSTLWAYGFLGSEDLGTNIYGAPKRPDGITHCVDCVIRLAEFRLGGGE